MLQIKGIALLPDPSAPELKLLMTEHGGVFHHYYSRAKVTHIIASNLPDSKVTKLTDKKVVHPKWITERYINDCISYNYYGKVDVNLTKQFCVL